jgi:ABC-type bacteriocin/lantibiotic exporter with double-glycine peptidase domain
MKKLITRHKTTITGILNLVMVIVGLIMMWQQKMTATEFLTYAVGVNVVATTILAAFAKDGVVIQNKEGGTNA